ncbi:phosphatase PAP2 family protein [Aestuariivirga sp.]|uniref:phosphatase PAP2 family protein n=1 Tax=Aestuariivirga sp. TaxID=2650926 RepID=UPI0039E363B5
MDMPASVAVGQAAKPARRFMPLLRKSISAHGIFLALITAYYSGFVVLLHLRPDFQPSDFLVMALGFTAFSVPIMFVGLLFMRFHYVATVLKPEKPIKALKNDLKAYLTNPGRLAHGLPMVFIMVMFMYVFVELKANIPLLNPFSWDTTLSHLDSALHFGRQPWEWLQPVLGYPPVTFLLNLNYNFWFAVMWIVWVYFAFSDATSITRTRFFLTFFIAWIIGGGVMAIYFSSVGPAFYGRLGLSPDPYAGLMAYLHNISGTWSIWAVPVQDELWKGYQGQSLIDGISAMPSMHNGTALLFALAVSKVNRTAGLALFGHAFFIFIGSIMLAWHYAIDTYAAWALVLTIWYLMEPVSRWWHSTAQQRRFAAALEAAPLP